MKQSLSPTTEKTEDLSHFDYVAKRFVYALLARNPNAIDRIKKDPLINELFSSQQTRDLGMTMGFAAEMERDFLSNYGTTIAINSKQQLQILQLLLCVIF